MSKIILDTDVSWRIETNVGWVTGLPKVGTGYFEYTPIFTENAGALRSGNITITYYTPTPTVEVIPVTQTGVGGYRNAKIFVVGLEEDSELPVRIKTTVGEYQNTFSPNCNTELDISGFMGSQTIPSDGENLTITLYYMGDNGYKPFLHQLNSVLFVETNVQCNDYIDAIAEGATAVTLTDNGIDGYSGNAEFNAGNNYAYFILDYRNIIANSTLNIDNLSASLVTNFRLGQNNSGAVVFSSIAITSFTTESIKEVNYDGQQVFKEESDLNNTIILTNINTENPYSTLSISPPTGTSFNGWTPRIVLNTYPCSTTTISNTKRDYYYDCLPDTPVNSYRHTNYYSATPDVGTQLLNSTTYKPVAFIAGWYRNSTYAFNLNSAGVVIERRLLACSEAGVPVLTAETFNIENGSDVEFKIVATNNPYKYRITSVYTDVSVLGGTTGGSWNYTDTEGATSIVNVGIGETVIVAGNYSTFTRTRGTDSTIVNGGQAALDGIFVTDDGVIKIGSDVGGTFSAVVVATNCVGNSANRTFTFIVSAPPVVPPDVCCSLGIPTGGTAGQILSKIDATDYNTQWIDEAPAASFTSTVKHQVKLGLAIAKGQAVYVTSADGTNMVVGKASNTSEATSSKTMGLLETGGSTNALVNVVTEGLLTGLNTSAATIGDPVWLGVGGALIYGLVNKPYAPAHLVFIGIVTRVNSSNGEIFVKPQNGFELKEIHDIDLITTTPINGHLLGFDGTLWVNKTIAGWLGFTPQQALTLTTTGTSGAATLVGATLNIPQYSGGGGTWGSITGTLSSQTDLQTALNAKQNTITNSDSITQGTTNLFLTSAERTKLTNTSGTNTGDQTLAGLGGVASNTAIVGATKTKITYDAKGLVTSGADATTADIADSLNKRYVTDAQATVIGNTSGTNSGDNAVNSLYSGLAASKEDTITAGTTSQYYRGDKSFQTLDKTAVGLANVDNTSDANKPVSTAQATAIGLKYDATNPSGFISNINALISQGTNITITGSGDVASPYVINASGGAGGGEPAIRKAQPRITRETYY